MMLFSLADTFLSPVSPVRTPADGPGGKRPPGPTCLLFSCPGPAAVTTTVSSQVLRNVLLPPMDLSLRGRWRPLWLLLQDISDVSPGFIAQLNTQMFIPPSRVQTLDVPGFSVRFCASEGHHRLLVLS